MTIKYQITPAYIAWRVKKLACNLVPSKKLRQKLKKSMPQKYDVLSFSDEAMAKYAQILRQYPDVLSPEDTFELACQKLSFSRIGDGEFNNIIGGRNSFNSADPALAVRLKEICEAGSTSSCLVCLNSYKLPEGHSAYKWFLHHGTRYLNKVLDTVKFKPEEYGDAYFLLRLSLLGNRLNQEGLRKIKGLWQERKVLFVCNSESPLIHDDLNLFDNVARKEFLYIPNKNAFAAYAQILTDIKKYDTSWLIYMEAGATASVLAWDLSKDGWQAFDMGDFYKRLLSSQNGELNSCQR